MKRIFTFLLGLAVSAAAMAADVESRITVSFYGHNEFIVLIDGQNVTTNRNHILLHNVRPGKHSIEVYRIRRMMGRTIDRPVYTATFTVQPQYNLDIVIAHNGYAQFKQVRNSVHDKGDYKNDRRYYEYEKNRYYNKDDDGYWNDDDYRYNNDDYRYNDRDYRYDDRSYGYGNRGGDAYNRAMSHYNFEKLLQDIKYQYLNKTAVAKEGIYQNYFTTQQVKMILQQFAFDNDKLELAKLAYRKTVDAGNYYQLFDVFTYENSRDQLDRYLRNNR